MASATFVARLDELSLLTLLFIGQFFDSIISHI